MENNFFHQSHVMPSGEDFYKCTAIMSQIQDFAPSDSSVRALINKLEDGAYETIINIKAAHGDFVASANQMDIVAALKEAKEDMMDRLTDWKIRRFKHAD